MMKRFLTPHQWKLVLFITAVNTAVHVLFFFVRRAIGWDTTVAALDALADAVAARRATAELVA